MISPWLRRGFAREPPSVIHLKLKYIYIHFHEANLGTFPGNSGFIDDKSPEAVLKYGVSGRFAILTILDTRNKLLST